MAPDVRSRRNVVSSILLSVLLILAPSSVTAPSSVDHRSAEDNAEGGQGRGGGNPSWLVRHVAVDSKTDHDDQQQQDATEWRRGRDAVSPSPSSTVCDAGGMSSYRSGQAAEPPVVGDLCAVGEDKDAVYKQQQVVVVESINKQVLEMLEVRPEVERVNFAAASDGAKVLASNVGAKRVGALLDDDSDTFMRNDCKDDDKWVVIELSQVAKVSMVELSQYELYSSRVNEFAVYGMHSHPRTLSGANTNGWHFLGKFQAAKKKGKQAFSIVEADGVEPDRWVRYLLIRFLSHHGGESVCAINEIGVFGVSAAEELEAQLAMADDEEVDDGISGSREGVELGLAHDASDRNDDTNDGGGDGDGTSGMGGMSDTRVEKDGRGVTPSGPDTRAGQVGEDGARLPVADTSVVRVEMGEGSAFKSSVGSREGPSDAPDSVDAGAQPSTCGAHGTVMYDEKVGGSGEVCGTKLDGASGGTAVDTAAISERPSASGRDEGKVMASTAAQGASPTRIEAGRVEGSAAPSAAPSPSSSSSSSSSGMPDVQIPSQSKKGSNVYETLVQELLGTKAQQKAIVKSFDTLAKNFEALSEELAALTTDSGLESSMKMQERIATLEGRLIQVGKAASAHSNAAVGMLAAVLGSVALQYLETSADMQPASTRKQVLPQMVRGLVVMNAVAAAALVLKYVHA